MPSRGERGAPSFDPNEPRELVRFFDDLEFLFTKCGITADKDKVDAAIRYLSIKEADEWKAIPAYSANPVVWASFKTAVLENYPLAADKSRYTMTDLEQLIGNRLRIGIFTPTDLADYTRMFRTITKLLKDNKLISDTEIQRLYVRGFQQHFWLQILTRLQIANPALTAAPLYDVEEVRKAANWLLEASGYGGIPAAPLTAPAPYPMAPSAAAAAPPSVTVAPEIKLEEQFAKLESRLVSAFANAMDRIRPASSTSQSQSRPSTGPCAFCGQAHFIRECDVVEEYIRAGKCKRNTEGKVVLPSNGFVPRSIQGNTLKDRIDEYHRQNPGQLAINYANGTPVTSSGTHYQYNAITVANTQHNTTSLGPAPTVTEVRLSREGRIAALKSELFNLESQANPEAINTVQTRSQRAREGDRSEDDNNNQPSNAPPQGPIGFTRDPPPHIPNSASSAPPAPRSSTPAPPARDPVANEPEHPYRNARDAAYAPPQTRNTGAHPPRDPPPRKDAAYRTLPPIYDSNIAKAVYERSMNTPIVLTTQEVLSLSSEVRAQYREATTTRRQPSRERETASTNLYTTPTVAPLTYPVYHYDSEDDEYYARFDNDSYSFSAPPANGRAPPKGATVVGDPYEAYYRGLPAGTAADPRHLTVSLETSAIRSIYPVVNHDLTIESILDPGSSIIAMSEEQCTRLRLAYDPRIILHMQSANGDIDLSLGLARNVPFSIAGLTFYLQVHVLREPAYDILLGRPFDVLTASQVQNFANEEQSITLHDPNSSRVVTVPTTARSNKRKTCNHPHHQDDSEDTNFRR